MTVLFDCDYCLVGGGLQSGLLATALRHYQPQARVKILERSSHLAGNHTWSFHSTDVRPEFCDWFSQLPHHQWPNYRVRFGDYHRVVHLGYNSIEATQFRRFIADLAAASDENLQLIMNADVKHLHRHHVQLDSDESISAHCVIDCRGPQTTIADTGLGFQKFFGWEVQLHRPWHCDSPVIMDVPVDQTDGFRFIYVLPFDSQRLLLQDTYFSDSAAVDPIFSAASLTAYLQEHGHPDFTVTRTEHGCLPMPFAAPHRPSAMALAAGYRGGWFHVATGYSLPLAVELADQVAQVPPSQAERVLNQLRRRHQWRSKFGRLLNRLLFRLVPPTSRQQIFRRFYQSLPESVIGRFFAHDFSQLDALRVLLGKPPLPLQFRRFLSSFQESL